MTPFCVIQGQFCSGGKPCLCGVLDKQGTSYIRENRFYLVIKEKDKHEINGTQFNNDLH